MRGFLRHFCKANDKPLLDLTPDAMNALLAYNWPGNVRELRTAIEHGVVMATGPKITLRDLPSAVRHAAGQSLPRGISATVASWKNRVRWICAKRKGNLSFKRSRRLTETSRPPQKTWNQPAHLASQDQRNERSPRRRSGRHGKPGQTKMPGSAEFVQRAVHALEAGTLAVWVRRSLLCCRHYRARWFLICGTSAASPRRRQWTRRKSAAPSPVGTVGERI